MATSGTARFRRGRGGGEHSIRRRKRHHENERRELMTWGRNLDGATMRHVSATSMLGARSPSENHHGAMYQKFSDMHKADHHRLST